MFGLQCLCCAARTYIKIVTMIMSEEMISSAVMEDRPKAEVCPNPMKHLSEPIIETYTGSSAGVQSSEEKKLYRPSLGT